MNETQTKQKTGGLHTDGLHILGLPDLEYKTMHEIFEKENMESKN